ncbi:MAG: hemolysin [Candidatus Epulonipiscioides saccharophilum]|nr:MAG: hemolysin [Epulopiscium sp. AS2M-Bin001]
MGTEIEAVNNITHSGLDINSWIQIGIVLLLIGGSAFFSMSETALMSISKIDARHMVSQDIKGAKLIQKLINEPQKLLGAILVGNNLVNIGATSLSTVLATRIFGNAGAGIATGVMTVLVLIFGEVTPKSIAAQNPQKVGLLVAPIIAMVVFLLAPVVKIIMCLSNILIKILAGKANSSDAFMTEEKLRTILAVSHEEGVIEEGEKEMITNVFDFGDSYVKDIMVPRTDMVALDLGATYEEVINLYKEYQFSRMPVYEDSHDNIVGMIYIKDLLLEPIDPESFQMKSVLREPYFVHEFKRTTELLKELRTKKIVMAFVVDEYGGTSGLLTLEDLVEEIVGELEDEYDIINENFVLVGDNEYIVDGSSKISDFNDKLNLNIESSEYDSVGGYLIGLLDKFPNDGEVIETEDIIFIVEETYNHRINSIRVIIRPKTEEEESEEDE